MKRDLSAARAQAPHVWLGAYERWAVWGAGRSGVAAANLLARHGKQVTLSDSNKKPPPGVFEALHPKVRLCWGENEMAHAEAIVTSPGLKPSLEIFHRARALCIPVLSEIELAFDCSTAPWIAVTGTDGKTTTTSLLGALCQEAGLEHVVAGNIGLPLCEVVEDVSPQGFIVAEVSAFQLWTTHTLKPRFACLTNLAADHLDYFDDDFQAYAEAKRALLARMRPDEDRLWLNHLDAEADLWARRFGAPAGRFALSRFEPPDPRSPLAYVDRSGRLIYERDGERVALAERVDALGLSGKHNIINMLCASAIAYEAGIKPADIERALIAFKGLPHRYEHIATVQGVRFIDDSKATNAHAALAGLRGGESAERRLVVITGGVDKGLDLSELASYLSEHAEAIVLIGALTERLKRALRARGGASSERIVSAASMEEAVRRAYELALKASAESEAISAHVVLSPAASSFDMFESYAHRGLVFQRAVSALER